MSSGLFHTDLGIFGIAVFIPAFAIATCASALVVIVDELITIELCTIINGRASNVR